MRSYLLLLLSLLRVVAVFGDEPAGIETARGLYAKQQYKQCLGVIEASPDRKHIAYLLLEANCEYALGNFTKALTQYESIGVATDEYSDPFIGQAKCHYMLKAHSKALNCYDVVLKRDPTNVVAARGRGASLIYLGQDQEAFKEYERTKELPFTADELDLWLHLLVKLRKFEEAVRYCQRNVVKHEENSIRSQRAILLSDRKHGNEQYLQMIKARPQLLDKNLTGVMEEWCIEAFAGRLTGARVYWSEERAIIPSHACSAVFLDRQGRINLTVHDAEMIRSIVTNRIVKPSDHDVSEFLWSAVVFEHFNAKNISKFVEATKSASDGKLDEEEFCLQLASAEHRTYQLARAFYVQVVWNGLNGKQTDPLLWHIDHPFDFDYWSLKQKDSKRPWRTYRGMFNQLKPGRSGTVLRP